MSAGAGSTNSSDNIVDDGKLPRIALHGVRLHAVTEQRAIEHVLSELRGGRGGVVVTPNVDHIRRCQRDLSFSAVVAEADLVVADGMPLVWASRLQGTPLPQRVAGSDLISSLSAAAAGEGRSIFLLGGDPGTADAAAAILRDRYPQLKVAGTFCPPVGFEKDDVELKKIIAVLKAARPDIVYVALGSPKQERLIDRIRKTLPYAWWLGVGVSFSFITGNVRRAPLWMRKRGLEWVHRLGQEPKRLFKRYIVVGLPFAALMLIRAVGRGVPIRLGLASPVVAEIPKTTVQLSRFTDAGELEQVGEENRRAALIGQQLIGQQEIYAKGAADGNGADGADGAHRSIDQALGLLGTTLSVGGSIGETIAHPSAHEDRAALAGRLRGLVLLGGMVRPSPLAMAVNRSVLDLPIGHGGTVLTRWLEHAAGVASLLGVEKLPVRLLVDKNAIEPKSGAAGFYSVERDTSDYRGTGGLLANVAVDYDDDDLILVGNAAQLLLDPLSAMLTALRKTGGVVSVVGHRDGTPSGLMLVTCRALRLIPKIGFVDMKEQALPAIASKYDVRVLQCRTATGLPIRSLADYIATLRTFHRTTGRPAATDPFAEDFKSTFAIVEPGASVAPTARVHDAVVLAGAVVEAGAVVVRSVVSGGGVVRKDRKAVDHYVTGAGRESNQRGKR